MYNESYFLIFHFATWCVLYKFSLSHPMKTIPNQYFYCFTGSFVFMAVFDVYCGDLDHSPTTRLTLCHGYCNTTKFTFNSSECTRIEDSKLSYIV